jgi:hypothetical protein
MCLQRFDATAALQRAAFRIDTGHTAVQVETALRAFNLFRAISFPLTWKNARDSFA